ncbi:MAG TPA: flavodoxin family protein [Caldilineae bacterium]|jgi:NAD(P)H dehydrogenase (quinone)|nr:flavodoxin family protein [Caldilineae bacterium]
MGKILVLYDSATGHTAKMAEYVARGARGVPGMEVRLKSVDEATPEDILWCDGLAVGSPTNLGVLSWKMKRFWDEAAREIWGKVDGKIACAFSSSGGWGGGAELTCLSLLTVLMNFGFLVFGVTDYVARQFTLHYGAVLAGEPRAEREIAACARLGERLAQWVAVYVDGRSELHPVLSRRTDE